MHLRSPPLDGDSKISPEGAEHSYCWHNEMFCFFCTADIYKANIDTYV